MRKPVVLFVSQSAHPWGGVESWLERLVAALEGDGWRVVVGLVRGRRHHDPDSYLALHPYRENVAITCRTGTVEGRVRAIQKALESVGPDVVVPVGIADVFEAVRRVRAAVAKPRLLAVLHGFGLAQLRDLAVHRGQLDRAVAVNRLLHAALVDVAGLDPERTGCVPVGAALPREDACRKEGPFRIAWVGRLCRESKRAGDVVPVAAALDALGCDFRLDVVGSGPLEEALIRDAERAGLVRKIRFRGFVSEDELLRSVYPGLDALLLTSDAEGGPIVAWEAMLHGAAVVTARYLGLAAEGALLDGRTALVAEPGDVVGLARHLAALAGDPDLRQRIGSAGRNLARKRYLWDVVRERWVRELVACLEGPPVSPEGVREPVRVSRGRLDRWLGTGLAETVRGALGLGMEHTEPGGEWPHVLSPEADEAEVRSTFAALEARYRSRPMVPAT